MNRTQGADSCRTTVVLPGMQMLSVVVQRVVSVLVQPGRARVVCGKYFMVILFLNMPRVVSRGFPRKWAGISESRI